MTDRPVLRTFAEAVGYLFRFFHQSASVNTAQASVRLETVAALNLTENL
jgi:hypothetical protein